MRVSTSTKLTVANWPCVNWSPAPSLITLWVDCLTFSGLANFSTGAVVPAPEGMVIFTLSSTLAPVVVVVVCATAAEAEASTRSTARARVTPERRTSGLSGGGGEGGEARGKQVGKRS